jgi:hypothetical protein
MEQFNQEKYFFDCFFFCLIIKLDYKFKLKSIKLNIKNIEISRMKIYDLIDPFFLLIIKLIISL